MRIVWISELWGHWQEVRSPVYTSDCGSGVPRLASQIHLDFLEMQILGPYPSSAEPEMLGKGLTVSRQAYQVILMQVQIWEPLPCLGWFIKQL